MFVEIAIAIASIAVSHAGRRHHEVRRQLALYPFNLVKLRQWHRLFTWPLIHYSRRHLAGNVCTLLGLAGLQLIPDRDAGILAVSATLLSCAWRIISHRDNPTHRAYGSSSIIAAFLYFLAVSNGNPWLIALCALNSAGELALYLSQPTGRIAYDAHLIAAAIGVTYALCIY